MSNDSGRDERGQVGRARRVSVPAVPNVKDITDYHKAGGKSRDWLALD